jgi:hypothetical protein
VLHMTVVITESVIGTKLAVTMFRQAEHAGGLPVRTWSYEGYLGTLTAGDTAAELIRAAAEELFNVASLRD